LGGPPGNLALGPQLQVAQWPVEPLGLVSEEPAVLVMMEEERASMVELRWEEGVEQVVKKVPPSSSS